MTASPIIIGIDFACNDPDNGLFAGRCSGIAVEHSLLEFDFDGMRRPPVFCWRDGRFQISRRIFAYIRKAHWVGNWCWDRAYLEIDEAIRFFEWLRLDGRFPCMGGDAALFDLWEADDDCDWKAFRVELIRAFEASKGGSTL